MRADNVLAFPVACHSNALTRLRFDDMELRDSMIHAIQPALQNQRPVKKRETFKVKTDL